jgi:hypothetical protein
MTIGQEPNQWVVKKFADFGASEEFVAQSFELFDILGATLMFGEQRTQAHDRIGEILVDGLFPAFIELRKIRASVGNEPPVVEYRQLYEDMARKLWKAYKVLMQRAAEAMNFDLGFLFQNDQKFAAGLKTFRELNPSARPLLEAYLREARTGWQNELADFRNRVLEHVEDCEREKFQKFYVAEFAEQLFDAVWRTIVNILAMLLELRFPPGTCLVEQGPSDPGPKWPKRFHFHIEPRLPTGPQ